MEFETWTHKQRDIVKLRKKNMPFGDDVQNLEFCECCVLDKSHKLKFNKGAHTSKGVLDYVHSDL